VKKIILFILLSSLYLFAEGTLLHGLIPYKPINDKNSISGSLIFRGSVCVGKFAKVWANKYKQIYPKIKINIALKDSKSGIEALINDRANIALSSKKITIPQMHDFRLQKGYYPTEIKVALDAIIIYANKNNPIKKVSLDELDAIFSKTRKRKYKEDINNWKQLGFSDNNISIYLYKNSEGLKDFFKDSVLMRGEYKDIPDTNYLQDFNSTIKAIKDDKYAISFGEMIRDDYTVKALSVSKSYKFPYFKPTINNIVNHKYPLTRYFYIYLDIPPKQKVSQNIYEFIKFIFSKDGQRILLNQGEIPISLTQMGKEINKIEGE